MTFDPYFREIVYAIILVVYVIAVVYGGKFIYDYIRSRGRPHNVAVYYIRKYIHVFAGGVVAVITPYIFTTPLIPLAMALLLAGFLQYMRSSGRLMWWFQVDDNAFEVNFTIAWGLSLAVLWLATDDPRIAILPAVFIAFGDAVTGIVRNMLFGKRTKHWIGNIAMASISIPLGFIYAGSVGALAGLVASIVERYEAPPIDDNVLIALASMIILLAGG